MKFHVFRINIQVGSLYGYDPTGKIAFFQVGNIAGFVSGSLASAGVSDFALIFLRLNWAFWCICGSKWELNPKKIVSMLPRERIGLLVKKNLPVLGCTFLIFRLCMCISVSID